MSQPECTITVHQLLQTLERSGSQAVTIFANGTGHFILGRFSAPRFHSLPDLSRFVADINERPALAVNPNQATQ